MITKKFPSYNNTIGKIKAHLRQNRTGQSIYDVSKAVKSDPRTVSSMLDIMENLNFVDVKKQDAGKKTYTEYKIRGENKMQIKTTMLSGILDSIVKEKDGFRFGHLWRHTDKSLGGVMPIIKDDVEGDDREYMMFEELKDGDKIKIEDGGSIDSANVSSSVKKPIFIRLGTMLKGDTQERAVNSSVIIMPNEQKIKVPVKCIHASKGIRGGALFKHAGSVPRNVEYSLAHGSGQSEVWNGVQSHVMCCLSSLGEIKSSTWRKEIKNDDLVGVTDALKKYKKDAKDILKNIPSVEGQVGCVIFDMKGVLSVEVYNHPNSWKAFHQSIYEKYEDILTEEQEEALFDIKQDAVPKLVNGFINRMKGATVNVLNEGKNYKTFALSDTVVGEVTELNNIIIHILGLRKEKDDKADDVKPNRIFTTF